MKQRIPAAQPVCWVALSPNQLGAISHFARSAITSDLRFDGDRDNASAAEVIEAWRRQRAGFVAATSGTFGREGAKQLRDQHDEDAKLLRLIDAAQRVEGGQGATSEKPLEIAVRIVDAICEAKTAAMAAGRVFLRTDMAKVIAANLGTV